MAGGGASSSGRRQQHYDLSLAFPASQQREKWSELLLVHDGLRLLQRFDALTGRLLSVQRHLHECLIDA